MKNNKINGLIIADVHIGAMPVNKLYEEFYNQVIRTIRENDIDYIIICGDWFDHKLYLNDKESLYSYKMIQDMIESSKDECKIRFVYGTESHESNQYDIISNIVGKDIDVIKYAKEEELFPNFNVLYLPEEHIDNKGEYYKEFLKEKYYNYVFGHGIIREGMKIAALHNEQNKSKRKKVPVFTTAELRRVCKGKTFFGHYHINTDLNDIYYVGSFSRWQFGEEEDKGFYLTSYDIDKDKYKAKFIVNTEAEVYTTIRYGYSNPVFKSVETMEKKLTEIDKMVDSHINDHVRFQFNIPSDSEKPEFIMNYLKERYKFKDKIKIGFEHGYVEEKRKQEKEKIKEENDKYSFIFDENMPFVDKVVSFITIEYNRDLKKEAVDTYLNKPLNEIVTSNEE